MSGAVEVNNTGRYRPLVAWIHWVSAALILYQIWLGFHFHDLPKGTPERADAFLWHKTVGVIILFMGLWRLIVRLRNPPPAYPENMAGWEKSLSTAVQWAFYFLLIALPLTGLAAVSKGGAITELAGGISFPTVPLGGEMGDVHEALVKVTIGLLVLHVAGALKHLLIDRDARGARMPLFSKRNVGN